MFLKFKTTLFIILCFCTVFTVKAEEVNVGLVNIDSGKVSGVYETKSPDVIVYRGIPFAAPPVGDLRWKPPKPVTQWKGVHKCDKFGPVCPQPKSVFKTDLSDVSEDCLYLNVWRPKNVQGKLPVMFWIHGGGHTTGTGKSKSYNGANLARKGVVVVTINYRLGPFGFMAHPLLSAESADKTSGNYGMLDQIEALKWVQRNIAKFGGNPENVTIFGESAGSVSVAKLMTSPPAKGLFHRAIAQSGGVWGRNRHLKKKWFGLDSAEDVGLTIAKRLGFDKAKDTLKALRSIPPEKLLEAATPSIGIFGKGIQFGPIVDGKVIPDDPGEVWLEGRQFDIPFMAGANADEGTIFMGKIKIKRPIGYRWLVKRMFKENADQVLDFFPPGHSANDIWWAFDDLITVSSFFRQARAMVMATEKKKSDGYLYFFTRRPNALLLKKYGSFHALEIMYAFGNLSKKIQPDETDKKISETMMNAWVNFARTGNPNGKGVPKWPAFTPKKETLMVFGDKIETKDKVYQKECKFFDNLNLDKQRKRETE